MVAPEVLEVGSVELSEEQRLLLEVEQVPEQQQAAFVVELEAVRTPEQLVAVVVQTEAVAVVQQEAVLASACDAPEQWVLHPIQAFY